MSQTVGGSLISLAKELNPSYSEIRELVVEVCIEVLTTNTSRGDVFCPGFMDLQVPHVSMVLHHGPPSVTSQWAQITY